MRADIQSVSDMFSQSTGCSCYCWVSLLLLLQTTRLLLVLLLLSTVHSCCR
jgi:hypothetical protein